jgi:hypothetical protein
MTLMSGRDGRLREGAMGMRAYLPTARGTCEDLCAQDPKVLSVRRTHASGAENRRVQASFTRKRVTLRSSCTMNFTYYATAAAMFNRKIT